MEGNGTDELSTDRSACFNNVIALGWSCQGQPFHTCPARLLPAKGRVQKNRD